MVASERTRRAAWVRVLTWWPILPLLAGFVLVYEAKQRYEEYVSVDASDVAMLQIPSPRPFVVCGSDYRPGGYPGLVASRCEALLADRSATTRRMFWGGVALVLVGAALTVRRVGVRRAWPLVAIGVAVGCWYAFQWLLHLPLRGGTCASVQGAGEMGYGSDHPCHALVSWAGSADGLLFLAVPVLGLTGTVAIIRRLIKRRRPFVPS